MSQFSLLKTLCIARHDWLLPVGMAIVLSVPNTVIAAPPLPVPNGVWVSEGSANLPVLSNGGLNMTIEQLSEKAIFRWDSFDIGKDNTVRFNQPGKSSIALNRVVGPDARPSEILGQLLANGSIYLINQNGIIFGEGAQVNVGSLVASTLDVDDQLVMNSSIIEAINNGEAAFDGTNAGSSIHIKPGAELTTDGGGRILVFAPSITNEGSIKTPDGQTILAAAEDKVYLTAVEDPTIRGGLLVEVETGGDVSNLGEIVAERGNITLLGMAVNQRGRLTATTSVNQNGSIRLIAREDVRVENKDIIEGSVREELLGLTVDLQDAMDDGEKIAIASDTGSIVFGENSVTEVLPDTDSTATASDLAPQPKSKVDIVGRQIHFKKNSQVTATSGEINIVAVEDSSDPFLTTGVDEESYVYLDEGSSLDVSGLDNVILPMERNSLAVELRDSDALKDSPLQKGGILSGETIHVDLRKGTTIADIQGALNQVQKKVSERMTAGGVVDIRSEGDVVQRSGSLIDVSGGSIQYESGFIQSSKLVSGRQVFDISEADPNRHYTQILGNDSKTHNKWGITEEFDSRIINTGQYVDQFVEGKPVGLLNIQAAAAWLDPNGVKADQVIGPYQRDQGLNLSSNGGVFLDLSHYIDSLQNIRVVSAQDVISSVEQSLLQAPDSDGGAKAMVSSDLLLSSNYLKNTGALTTSVDTNGAVSIQSAIEAGPGASLALSGTAIDVSADIRLQGGDLSLESNATTDVTNATITVAEGVDIDTRGLWVNDNSLLDVGLSDIPLFVDGGDVEIIADGDLLLGAGSSINASGGAHLDVNGDLHAGKGGDITLAAINTLENSRLSSKAVLKSYGLEQGGELTLRSNRFLVTDNPSVLSTPEQMVLAGEFFQQGGFSAYQLDALLNGIEIASGTEINATAKNYIVEQNIESSSGDSNSFSLEPSLTEFESFAALDTLPDFGRKPVDIFLNSTLGQNVDAETSDSSILMGTGSSLHTDPGAKVFFISDSSIFVDGIIDAPAGDITLKLQAFNGDVDKGFLKDQSIWLGENSQLSARGAVVERPSNIGGLDELYDAVVFNAGDISLVADRGYVISSEGSKIDLSGVSAEVDQLVPSRDVFSPFEVEKVTVTGSAGTLSISGQEGVYLDGDINAKAADVAGAAGGLFDLTFGINGDRIQNALANADLITNGLPGFIFSDRHIIVQNDKNSGLNQSLIFGDEIDNSFNGSAIVSSELLKSAGFDRVELTARDFTDSLGNISLQGDLSLTSQNSIVFNSKAIEVSGGNAVLNSSYVSLGSEGRTQTFARTSSGGASSLTVNANLIDLTGNLAIQGTDNVTLNSQGDIRLEGIQENNDDVELTGRFAVAENLTLKADQVYPSTFSDFSITAGNQISILKQGAPSPVLSAVGRLIMEAPVIQQNGVLKAPFGEIILRGSDSVSLGQGSVTSVSGEDQTVLFGQTQLDGLDWFYSIANRRVLFNETIPVEKRIELDSPDIELASGSTVDLSGGGDLLAYEFIPGPGGSKDTLAPENNNGAFAILPNFSGDYSPLDQSLTEGFDFDVGQRVVLAGSANGLEAGEYTVLPARYAMLPGAFLVTPTDSVANVFPGQTSHRIDGAPIVAGQLSIANTGIQESRWSGYVIEPGSIVNTRSEYVVSSANQFFTRQSQLNNTVVPLLPQDAGILALKAVDRLVLDGEIAAAGGAGGRGAQVDIQADKLAVVNQTGLSASDVVELEVNKLNTLNVESLLLGGSRSRSSSGTEIDVQADEITVAEDVELTAPDIILAASDQITVQSNASVNGQGEIGDFKETFIVDGDGALLRASAGQQAVFNRNESSSPTEGSIDIANNATIAADRSIILDASFDVDFNGNIEMNDGSLQLGANKVSLGETAAVSDGLVLSKDNLASINLDELVLTSRSTIDLYGEFDFSATNLVLRSAGIQGFDNAGKTATLRSEETLTLSNINNESFVDTATGSGSLSIFADIINVDAGDLSITGFNNIELNAAQQLRGVGTGKITTPANLTVKTPMITAATGADTTLISSGRVDLLATEFNPDQASSGLGAQLAVEGDSILADTLISLPSGQIQLTATGSDSSDHVTLSDGAKLDVAGRDVIFGNEVVGTDAGIVKLSSVSGNVVVHDTAEVNVSATSGDAGALVIAAKAGRAELLGDFIASSESGRGGIFGLDVLDLPNFSSLNSTLSLSGFNREIDIRQRSGDINIAAQDRVTANHISLSADNGEISVAGTLDARGDSGGRIELSSKDDLTLLSTSNLLANAKSDSGKAGKVFLSSVDGGLSLDAGSTINVSSGSDVSKGGLLVLRTPRNLANNDVLITDLAADIYGAERIELHAGETYIRTTTPTSDADAVFTEATSFMSNEAAIKTRLGAVAQGSNFHLMPEIHIHSTSDLTIGSELDLLDNRFNGDGIGVLTLSAEGDLIFNQSLTDAFATVAPPADAIFGGLLPDVDELQTGESWSYNLIAGADTSSASIYSVISGVGDINLAAGVKVRTGTGSIRMAAGNDLVLQDKTSVIYTAGQDSGIGDVFDPLLTDFALIPNIPAYPVNGGDLEITVGGDFQAALSDQLFTGWLQRVGGDSSIGPVDSTWAIVFEHFQQGVGALGGGDVNINAGGDIVNLNVSIPTTGKQLAANNGEPLIQGGGDLYLHAGGDIKSARVMLGKGQANISAAGNIDRSDDSDKALVLALGDVQANVFALGDVEVAAVTSPTIIPQSSLQSDAFRGFDVYADTTSYFFTYGQDSKVSLESLTKDILFTNTNDTASWQSEFVNIDFTPNSQQVTEALFTYPGELEAVAVEGDIHIDGSFILVPSYAGGITLMAGRDIFSDSTAIRTSVTVSAVDPQKLPTSESPIANFATLTSNGGLLTFDPVTALDRNGFYAAEPTHVNDQQQSLIIANRDIQGINQFFIQSPEQTNVVAGRDIKNVSFTLQNNRESDISLIEAGRDIIYPNVRDASGNPTENINRIEIFGPGRLDVIAGRDVNLGGSEGITSLGNIYSRGLSDKGADITVMTGISQQPDYSGFIEKYLVDDVGFNDELIKFITSEQFAGDLISLISEQTSEAYDSHQDAVSDFLRFDDQLQNTLAIQALQQVGGYAQRELLLDIYFSELKLAGIQALILDGAIEAQDGMTKENLDPLVDGYVRGFNAINTLFPGANESDNPYSGGLNMAFSSIRTTRGGDINFVTPGGEVNAGLAVVPQFGAGKSADELGVITGGTGNINGMAQNDIAVNLSRIFALGGGNVTLWSSAGDIDAGRGAKSALSVPPPQISFDPDTGDVIEETPSAVSGSGIQCASVGGIDCSLSLSAPQGVVDAGEAGIAGGDVFLAATEVLNSDNIDAGGVSVGIPVSSGVSASVAGASSSGTTATDAAQDSLSSNLASAAAQQEAIAFLTVDVIGIGE